MDGAGSGTISTDSASQGHGSDVVVRMGDLLPHVEMDAPPDTLAEQMNGLATNPYIHFELAPHMGGALEYVVGKKDPVQLRVAAAAEGLGPAQHVVQDEYESWINRKVMTVEGAEGEQQTVECDGLRVVCAEDERAGICDYLKSAGFWVFAPEEVDSHYNFSYAFGGTPLRHVAEGLASERVLAGFDTRLVEERMATGRWNRTVYVAGNSNQLLPDISITVNGVGHTFAPRSVVGASAVTVEGPRPGALPSGHLTLLW